MDVEEGPDAVAVLADTSQQALKVVGRGYLDGAHRAGRRRPGGIEEMSPMSASDGHYPACDG